MKQDTIIVHCVYTQTAKCLSELLDESFRLYLQRILALSDSPALQYVR